MHMRSIVIYGSDSSLLFVLKALLLCSPIIYCKCYETQQRKGRQLALSVTVYDERALMPADIREIL